VSAVNAAAAGSHARRRRSISQQDVPRLEVRVQVKPPWPYRLPARGGMDGLTRIRNGVVHRLVHDVEQRPVLIRVAQLISGDVLFGAQAADRAAAEQAIAQMRRALGVDLDLRPFYERFRDDRLIGAALRANPTLRPAGRPDPFEAFAWAVTEQLIEFERAVAIQRRIVWSMGRFDAVSDMRDSPSAAALAGASPAQLESFDLSGGRAVALIRASREIARGRIELDSRDPVEQESGWRRLRMIPGIGSWTVEMLALIGQGRVDQIPAGDLGFVKLVGRLLSGGDPRARATEEQVREVFAPYEEWRGLAGAYAIRSAGLRKSPIIPFA
jgi:3-methyladenine DNA glycosylase/8-oxoguanine DNA glycosylase